MKRIFFIINCFSAGGGAEALLTQIVNNLDEAKYEIGIMEIIHNTIKKEPTKSHIKIYPYYVEADDPERKRKMYYVYHEWDKIIEEYIPKDYDLYVSFNYLKPSFLLPPGKKNIAWIHGDIYNLTANDKTEEKELQRESLKKANRIVTISDITKQSVIDLYPEYEEKICVLYNGVDIQGVKRKAEQTTDVEIMHPAILGVGRLEDNKNPFRLLEVFETLSKKNNLLHLYYMGYGPLEQELKETVLKKNIQDRVHFLGYKDNPFPIVKQADVLAMFSKSEGFGLAIAEGLCLGKPFIGTNVGALEMLSLNQTCGLIIEKDEMIDADKVLCFIDKDEIVLKEACYESIKRFSMEQYIERIEKMFDEVLDEN